MSIRNGVAGGNSDTPTDSGLAGGGDGGPDEGRQHRQQHHRHHQDCASFSSLHAEPTAMYIDP